MNENKHKIKLFTFQKFLILKAINLAGTFAIYSLKYLPKNS